MTTLYLQEYHIYRQGITDHYFIYDNLRYNIYDIRKKKIFEYLDFFDYEENNTFNFNINIGNLIRKKMSIFQFKYHKLLTYTYKAQKYLDIIKSFIQNNKAKFRKNELNEINEVETVKFFKAYTEITKIIRLLDKHFNETEKEIMNNIYIFTVHCATIVTTQRP